MVFFLMLWFRVHLYGKMLDCELLSMAVRLELVHETRHANDF